MKCEFLGIDIQVHNFFSSGTCDVFQPKVIVPYSQDDQGRHEVGMVENTVKTPLGINQEGCLFEAR